MNIQKRVEKLLDEEKVTAKSIAHNAKAGPKLDAAVAIRAFFPELSNIPMGRISNLPSGIPMLHQILLGPPTVFDLAPISEAEFEQRYRFKIQDAAKLIEMGLLIPSVYERNPKKWAGAPKEFARVFETGKVISTGARVELFFESRDSEFNEKVKGRTGEVNAELDKIRRSNGSDYDKLKGSDRKTSTAIATRWSYLEQLQPQAFRRASELVKEDLVRAEEYIRVAKHLCASPITAALGHEFIWGPRDKQQFYNVHGSFAGEIGTSSRNSDYPREYVDYLISEVTDAEPLNVVESFQFEHLLKLHKGRDLIDLKKQLFDLMDTMATLHGSGKVIQTGQVNDWKDLHKEINEVISVWNNRTTNAGKFAAKMLSKYFGVILQAEKGIEPGSPIEILGEIGVEAVSEGKGELLYGIVNPTKHRFFGEVQQIKSQAGR